MVLAYKCLQVYITDKVDVSLNYSRMRSVKLNLNPFRFLVVSVHWIGGLLDLFGFNPGADSQNLIEIQRDLLLLNEPLDLSLGGRRQNPHQGLGGEPVLGPLLVIALYQAIRLRHVGHNDQSEARDNIIPEEGHGRVRELSGKCHE